MDGTTIVGMGYTRPEYDGRITDRQQDGRMNEAAVLAKMDGYRQQGLFVDVNFSVSNKDFKAHKVVLSSQSAVFEAMFASGMEESRSGQVNIEDIEPDVFEIFLSFLYTSKLAEADLSTHLAELLYCADKYCVPNLTACCARYLERSDKSLLHRLALSDMYNVHPLKTDLCKTMAECGWDLLQRVEWFDLLRDFHLTTEVLKFVWPSCLKRKFTITPEMWPSHGTSFQLNRAFIRNNGHCCEISTHLQYRRKTIFCSLVPLNPTVKMMEFSFEYSISNVGGETQFSGKGDVWWEALNGKEVADEMIFRHTLNIDTSVRNTILEFTLTLKPWESPVLITPEFSQNAADQRETVSIHVAGEAFAVDKAFACRESEFFENLLSDGRQSYDIQYSGIGAFKKIHSYLLTGIPPPPVEVDFPMVLCARWLRLIKLFDYCKQSLDQSLIDSASLEMRLRSVELLIFAHDNNIPELVDSALTYIDYRLKEVVCSPAWERLRDRTDLLYLICKKIYSANVDCSSDSMSDSDSETDVEAMMDRVG